MPCDGTARRTPHRLGGVLVALAILGRWWLWTGAAAWAQQPGEELRIRDEAIVTGGGFVGSVDPLGITTAIGEPIGGSAVNDTFTVLAGYQATIQALLPGPLLIAVEGAVSEPHVSVDVNGHPASVSPTEQGATFHADAVRLIEGSNTLTVTATDRVKNRAQTSVSVYLDRLPPARPTVATDALGATVDAQGRPLGQDTFLPETAQVTLSGTKIPGTAIWINGQQVVPLNDETTWRVPLTLVEGDNVLVIVTREPTGSESVSNTLNLILDQLPPVISDTRYEDLQGVVLNVEPTTQRPKTNFSPVTVRGALDDSLTRLTINGQPDHVVGPLFEIHVPLQPDANDLAFVAISPNDLETRQTEQVVRGAIPMITQFSPPDGGTLALETTVPLEITAVDPEPMPDPIEYQVVVDGMLFADWDRRASNPWTPTPSGLHTLTVAVRDAYGGTHARDAEVFVVQVPLEPPER